MIGLIKDLDVHQTYGIGLLFRFIIECLYKADIEGCKPYVCLNNPRSAFYEPERGPDIWSYYFLPIGEATEEESILVSPSAGRSDDRGIHLTGKIPWDRYKIETAHKIYKKYVKLRPEIEKLIDEFSTKLDDNTLCIHLRGTDECENPIVQDSHILKTTNKVLLEHNIKKIFLMTDDLYFLDFMKHNYPQQLIYRDIKRGKRHEGLHKIKLEPPYIIGLNAVIDAFCGARCAHYLYTKSNFATMPMIVGEFKSIRIF